jgi:hypothetical protein
VIPFIGSIQTGKSTVSRVLESRWDVTDNRYGVSFWAHENVLKLDGDGGCTTL